MKNALKNQEQGRRNKQLVPGQMLGLELIMLLLRSCLTYPMKNTRVFVLITCQLIMIMNKYLIYLYGMGYILLDRLTYLTLSPLWVFGQISWKLYLKHLNFLVGGK